MENPMAIDLVKALSDELPLLAKAAISLPVAAVLSAALAFRPQRVGTPQRDLEVIHAQVILGVVGALVMLVIGDSLARAFGIVGAAGLVRYRAKVADPKDAGVMLSTLGVGLASGVGLYQLAVFGTLFLLFLLWLVESHTPQAQVHHRLKISTGDPLKFQPKIETILRKHRLSYELRASSENELEYEVMSFHNEPTDAVLRELQKLESEGVESFAWKRKKDG
jgi:hypothetical protein